MKVYVDELPKSCIDCPCESEYCCNLLDRDIEFLELTKGCKDCPLKSLTDHTKQVRKEVVQDIREKVKNLDKVYLYPDYTKSDVIECILDDVDELLDQIQGKGE